MRTSLRGWIYGLQAASLLILDRSPLSLWPELSTTALSGENADISAQTELRHPLLTTGGRSPPSSASPFSQIVDIVCVQGLRVSKPCLELSTNAFSSVATARYHAINRSITTLNRQLAPFSTPLAARELQSQEEADAGALSQTPTARILYRYKKYWKSPYFSGVNMAAKCQAGSLFPTRRFF